MPMVINTNNASISTQRSLYSSSTMLEISIQRLSTGKRINSAKDDAAGLAISERMTTQIRGMTQAISNASNAISLAQTAEGALGNMTESLQRIRELALQSANDVNSASDRVALNQEATQLLQELERTATQTTYNGRTLLDGTFTAQQFQIGAEANQTVAVTLGSARLSSLGVNSVSNVNLVGATNTVDVARTVGTVLPTINNVTAQTLTIQGSTGTANNVLISASSSAQSIAQTVNQFSNVTNVTASARTVATFGGFTANGAIAFDLHGSNGTTAVRIATSVANNTNLQSVADAINLKSSQTGITAAANGATVILTSNDGYDIGVANYANTSVALNQNATFQGQAGAAVTLLEGTNDSSRVGGRVTFNSPEALDVQSTTDTILNNTTGLSSTLTALATLDITTSVTSNIAITVIDGALSQINSQRAGLGATQKRVTQTISNLQNVHENLSAARSRLVDTDFAAESSALTRAQILQQAGTAMLAQANATPNQVLQLLQG